jgi:glutamate racemase
MRIGVFDSGMGGITVLRELIRRHPRAEFLYFGDNANVPYGSKSPAQIRALVRSASERMKTKKVDALVVACNTAASLAREQFLEVFPDIPIVDVVQAGVRACLRAVQETPGSTVLILGTRATVKSRIYEMLLHDSSPGLPVLQQACPLFVPMIEEGWITHPILHATVREYLGPYKEVRNGVALLACTHYPWIESAIQAELPEFRVLNSAEAAAEILKESLPDLPAEGSADTRVQWFFSDPDGVSRTLLGEVAAGAISPF